MSDTCKQCRHFDPDGQRPRCRRFPPVAVANTGLGEQRFEYPVLTDLRGCGEHKPFNNAFDRRANAHGS